MSSIKPFRDNDIKGFKIHPLARKSIGKVLPYVVSPFQNVKYHFKLSDNENPYGGKYCRYPDPFQIELKRKYLAFLFSQDNNSEIFLNEKNVLFCNGSEEGIDLLIKAFCEPTLDRVCITPPTFPLFSHWARAYGNEVNEVPLLGSDFQDLDIENILRTEAKILYLCTPNNPIGNLLKVEQILKILKGFKGIVVIDEAYQEFSEELSNVRFLKSFPNLVILRSFSKAWGLAGVRAGAIIAGESILHSLLRVKAPFSFSTPAQESLAESFDKVHTLKKTWEIIILEREKLRASLKKIPGVLDVFPSVTNFLLVQFREHEKALSTLLSKGFTVRDCSPYVKDTLRISIGEQHQNRALVEALSSV